MEILFYNPQVELKWGPNQEIVNRYLVKLLSSPTCFTTQCMSGDTAPVSFKKPRQMFRHEVMNTFAAIATRLWQRTSQRPQELGVQRGNNQSTDGLP